MSYVISTSIKVEPYWNVNVDDEKDEEYYRLIKVEPYWNVNFGASSIIFFISLY